MSQGYTPTLGEDPEKYQGSCRGKVRHSSKKLAAAICRRLIESGTAYQAWALGAYKCRGCGSWHIGHDFRRFRTEH